jgi:hypothetical protein
MESDEDDLYGQDDHNTSNGAPQDGRQYGEVKMEDLEEGEEEGEELEDEGSDDVGLARNKTFAADLDPRTTSFSSPTRKMLQNQK